MEIWVIHTQEVYEHFIVSLVLNKKILGEIAKDSFKWNNLRRYGGAPGSGGISFQLELDGKRISYTQTSKNL